MRVAAIRLVAVGDRKNRRASHHKAGWIRVRACLCGEIQVNLLDHQNFHFVIYLEGRDLTGSYLPLRRFGFCPRE